jgi:hypothetical protein
MPKVTLIKDYPGLDRKAGDKIDCTDGEKAVMIENGYVEGPKKAKASGASG